MRSDEVLQAIHDDHAEVRDMAKRIQAQLRRGGTRGPLEVLAASVLDFNASVLLPHTDIEEQALLHVAREHLADIHPARLEEAEFRRAELIHAFADLRTRVQGGDDLRVALRDVAAVMHDYVAYEENVLLPWLEVELGDALLREVAQRFEAIRLTQQGEVQQQVAADVDALARIPP